VATHQQYPLSSLGRRTAVVAAMGGILLAATGSVPPTRTAGGTISDASCPHDVRIRIARAGQDSAVFDSIPSAGPISNAPEFHDCQRLLDGESSTYGTKAGVWASWRLDRLLDSLAAVQPRTAVTAAQVYSWDGPYAPLGIEQHFNCLYVWRESPRRGEWRAWMLPVGDRGDACLNPRSIDALSADSAFELRMEPMPHALAGDHVPPVTRWEWNDRGRHQTIGLRCGTEWCIVGRRVNFGASRQHRVNEWPAALPPNAPATPDWLQLKARVIEIRGWYDEQRLAPPEMNPSQASDLRALVVPDPRLRTYQQADFQNYTWQPAAYVVMPAANSEPARTALAGYRQKFNFETGWNMILLCAGQPRDCLPALTLPPNIRMPAGGFSLTCRPVTASESGMPGERWTAVVISHRGTVRPLCVTRRMYPVVSAMPSLSTAGPGTARWRWRVDDEPVWVSCLGGCCEVEN
jgi:hypothetical protein